jgi:hypothetical protein
MKSAFFILIVFGTGAAALAQPAAPGGGAQSLNPDLAAILDLAGGWRSAGHPGGVGGHDPQGNGLTLQALELALGAAVDPFFRFDASILASGAHGVELEEAFATTLGLPGGLQARAGQFLTRFGRLNPTHPHAWDFADAPLVNGLFLGPDGARGAGAELSWLTPLPWFAELVGSATGPDLEALGEGAGTGVKGPRDLVYTLALKQFFTLSDDWSLLWGLSGQAAPVTPGTADRATLVGGDLLLAWRPVDSPQRAAVTLQLEGMGRRRQVGGARLDDWGGYASLVWKPLLRWEAGLRGDLVRVLERGPQDPGPPEGPLAVAAADLADRARGSAQLTFYPSHFSRLRLQGGLETREGTAGTEWSVMLALEVVAGAHGAHKY